MSNLGFKPEWISFITKNLNSWAKPVLLLLLLIVPYQRVYKYLTNNHIETDKMEALILYRDVKNFIKGYS
jgi:hypothetical protein